MSYQKLKINSNCVGGRHHSGTISIEGEITKTGQKLLLANCPQCKNKSMVVGDNTIEVGGPGKCFKNIGKSFAVAGKKRLQLKSNFLEKLWRLQQKR